MLSEAKMIRNDVEDEKCSRKANFCKTLKNLGKSGLKDLLMLIALVVVTMSHMSGVSLITTYIVDIFCSTGISEIVLVLVTGLSEMLFSSFQVIIADKLGRSELICFWQFHMISLFRKTFLILSGVGCSLATLAFAGIFWKIDNPGHVVKYNNFIVSESKLHG